MPLFLPPEAEKREKEGSPLKAPGSLSPLMAHWVVAGGQVVAQEGPSPTKSLQEVLTNHSDFSVDALVHSF